MKTLPLTLPAAYKLKAGQQPATSDVDTGGYDVLIGGIGFRLATDQQFPYVRATEPTTVHRFDNSAEVGEQTLSPLPWVKSQSSFHAGAGQMNLEAPFTAFQYQQEQIAHLRYDTSLGVDPWTPGLIQRLPDTTFSNFGFDVKCVVTAVVNGVDVAVVGGTHSLYQITWASGPDVAPTVTAIDMTSATYGGLTNITISSLTTDGRNYYGIVQLTSVGSTAGILTYVVSGQMESTAAPVALYEVPNYKSATPRTNLCTNPNFETATTGWAASGTPLPTIGLSGVQKRSGVQSLIVTSTGTSTFFEGVNYTASGLTVGAVYTFSVYVYNPSVGGVGDIGILIGGGSFGAGAGGTKDSWKRISVTWTATATTHSMNIFMQSPSGAGSVFYVDDALLEQSGTIGAYFNGGTTADSSYTYSWSGTANLSTSIATPIQSASNAQGVCAWVKERLISALSNSVYELSPNTSQHSALPTAKYTHPISAYMYSAISESPDAILISGTTGLQCTIMQFKLDTSGGTPTLGAGATIATLPTGEQVLCMAAYLGSFIALGTNKGIRVGTFDTYSGHFTYGPLSVVTTSPVYGITGRDRFVFGGFTNQQADGKTGLVRVDLTQPIDASGRLAWSPDLRPPVSAPTGLGTVYGVGVLPQSGRLMFATSEGFHVEGNGPGSSGTAWLRTSRIRYDTEELKLFKAGRIHGSLDTATITVVGLTQFGGSANLGTFGFLNGSNDPGEFGLPSGLNPWIQLQFQLNGSSAVLNSYSAKALPAPTRQRVITITVNCFRQETDRYGLDVTDPLLPRDRYAQVKALESSGNEIRFVEFTNTGPIATLVVIDQLEYHSFSRPNIDDDFGGYITFKLRETVGS